MQLHLSKTGKQTAFPIKTFYDIGKNYNLKPPTANCLGRGGQVIVINTWFITFFTFITFIYSFHYFSKKERNI